MAKLLELAATPKRAGDRVNETSRTTTAGVIRVIGAIRGRLQPESGKSATFPGLAPPSRVLGARKPPWEAAGAVLGAKRNCREVSLKPLRGAAKSFCSAVKRFCSAVNRFCSAVKRFCSAANPFRSAAKRLRSAVDPFCGAVDPSCSAVERVRSAAKPICGAVKPVRSAVNRLHRAAHLLGVAPPDPLQPPLRRRSAGRARRRGIPGR